MVFSVHFLYSVQMFLTALDYSKITIYDSLTIAKCCFYSLFLTLSRFISLPFMLCLLVLGRESLESCVSFNICSASGTGLRGILANCKALPVSISTTAPKAIFSRTANCKSKVSLILPYAGCVWDSS